MAEDLIVKSVRLTSEEAAGLTELAGRLHATEGSLLRRFVVEGTRQAQLDEGLLAYVKGQANLVHAAHIAHLPEAEFDEQLRLRGILGPGALDTKADAREESGLFWVALHRFAQDVGSDRLLQLTERMRDDPEGSGRKPIART